MFVFERERGRESEWVSTSKREAERERETESETGSRLHAVSIEPYVGLGLTNCEIRPEPKSDAQPTKPPRCPLRSNFKAIF